MTTRFTLSGFETPAQAGFAQVLRRDLIGADPDALRERLPWKGADLQTIAHRAMFRQRPIPGTARAMEFPLSDGSGDRMTGTLHDPGQGGPLMVLMHGVAGCEDSVYMWDTAHYLASLGHRVLRLNMRGAGSSISSCSVTYQCDGVAEIIDILDLLEPELAGEGAFMVGFSMGGVILLNTLARLGADHRIIGALTVSAPLDLPDCSARIHQPRNVIYQKALLRDLMRMEQQFTGPPFADRGAPLPRPRSLRDYDHQFTALRHGYDSAEAYYHHASPKLRLADISLPVMLLHAGNDPWIPDDGYRQLSDSGFDHLRVLLTPRGGHVGFHFHGYSEPFFAVLLGRLLDAM